MFAVIFLFVREKKLSIESPQYKIAFDEQMHWLKYYVWSYFDCRSTDDFIFSFQFSKLIEKKLSMNHKITWRNSTRFSLDTDTEWIMDHFA